MPGRGSTPDQASSPANWAILCYNLAQFYNYGCKNYGMILSATDHTGGNYEEEF